MTGIPDILDTAHAVVKRANHVRIDRQALAAWAGTRDPASFPAPTAPPELVFEGDREACANLCLLQNCLNFCFWSDQPWVVEFRGQRWTRTYAMFASILRAVEKDASWLSARRWMRATEREAGELLRGDGRIPLPAERHRVLNETGAILQEQFDGRMAGVVEQAGGSARKVAYELAERFPSFRDVATHDCRQVAFLKRAQICAADIHRAWQRIGPAGLEAMEALTAFADYRLPQYLRHVGILELDAAFEARIERKEEIPAGSIEEVELRAAAIVAVELIRREYDDVPAWKIDFHLWKHSHDYEVRLKHHRTRSVYY